MSLRDSQLYVLSSTKLKANARRLIQRFNKIGGLMAADTDSYEKDVETLGEVTLHSFKAEPPTIHPFSSSKLSWDVKAPTSVTVRLDGADVPKGGERWVSPSATEAYRLSAKAGRLSKDLGVAVV